MNGIQVLDRPASQKFYAVAGRFLFVQCFDLRLAPRIEQLFSGWQLTPVSSPVPNPDIKIDFSTSDMFPEVSGGVNEFEVSGGVNEFEVSGGVNEFEVAESGRCFSTAGGLDLVFENSMLRLSGKNPVDVSLLIRKIPSPSDAELARVTSFAVCAALRRFGLFELHSAAVTIPETGSGVLIIGASGSGKSTLASRLATSGWGYLSDDEVLLSVVDEKVEARGFRSFFALRQDGPSKLCFEPDDVFNSRPIASAIPRYLLFSAVQREDKTQWRELTQAETMSRLIRACPWATYDTPVAGPYLDILSRLARQSKGVELKAGTDLLDATEASRIITSVCR